MPLIYTIAEILFPIFHLSVVILMFAKRKTTFKGPFYNTFRVVIVADFANFIYICIFNFGPTIPSFVPFFRESSLFGSIMITYFIYTIALIYFGHTIMALNRLTIIWFPLQYKRIWKRPWYIYLLIILPFLNQCWRIHEPAKYQFLTETTVKLSYTDPKMASFFFIHTSIIFVTFTFLAAILNGFSFVKFCLYKNNSLNVNEKNLLFVSMITFVVQLLRSIYTVQLAFFPEYTDISLSLSQIAPFFNDAFGLSGSISLLLLSKNTRKEYLQFYFPNCKNTETIKSKLRFRFHQTNVGTTTTSPQTPVT